MHRLMGSSPVVDRSAIANSTTELNVNILSRSCSKGSEDSIQAIDESFIDPILRSAAATDHGSDAMSIAEEGLEEYDAFGVTSGTDSDVNIDTIIKATAASTTREPVGKKSQKWTATIPKVEAATVTDKTRKSGTSAVVSDLAAIAKAQRESQGSMMASMSADRLKRAEMKRDASLQKERMRIECVDRQRDFDREEHNRARQHELALLDRQIDLARLQQK